MAQLQNLNLRFNQLETLPEGIIHLHNLEVLDLRANRLTRLPENLHHLKRLRKLDLRWNALTQKQPCLDALTKQGCCVFL